MMKKAVFVAMLGVALISAGAARAQGFGGSDDGCPGSPENPTLVLAGLATGGFALSTLRIRLRARRKSSKPE
jgi:XrtJ-associated TM-motif-TM protein